MEDARAFPLPDFLSWTDLNVTKQLRSITLVLTFSSKTEGELGGGIRRGDAAVEKRNRKILVVEDDRDVAFAIQAMLTRSGYAVTVAADGLAALHAFDAERPDLVTVDLHVPAVSGYRLVTLLRRHAPKVPIVVVTAASFEEAQDLAKLGIDGFLAKPFQMKDFVSTIEAALAR